MILIAVDPGKTCGFFRLNAPGTTPYLAEYDDPFNCVRVVQGILNVNLGADLHVVVERFTFTSIKQTRQYDALEVIGALRYVARLGGASFTLQSRSDKTRVTNDMLRRLDWYTVRGNGHANAAAQHGLVFLSRRYPDHPAVRQALARI